MALSHRELNRLFIAIEAQKELPEVTFRGWLAWPIVKGQLWHAALAHGSGGEQPRARRVSRAALSWRALLGLRELWLNLSRPKAGWIAVLYSPRTVQGADGSDIHPHLGAFLQANDDVLACRDRAPRGVGLGTLASGTLHQDLVGVPMAAASRLWRWAPEIRQAAAALSAIVAPRLPVIPAPLVAAICRDALARFVVKHAVFRRLFARSGIRAVLVTDPDSKCPEVAAAKTLGLPVIELQHGMFGAEEPDYSWTAAFRPHRDRMPVPDRVLVFGPLWRDALLRNGFWTAAEAQCVGNAALCAGQRPDPSPPPHAAPLRVLFPTQYYVSTAAAAFWAAALALQEERQETIFELRIKIHPIEAGAADEYISLCRRFPASCRLVDPQVDGLAAIAEADLVVGYTSFMLLEAVGLGRGAISLSGGSAEGGLAGTFDLPELERIIPTVIDPEALITRLRRWPRASGGTAPDRRSAALFHFPQRPFHDNLRDQIAAHVA